MTEFSFLSELFL